MRKSATILLVALAVALALAGAAWAQDPPPPPSGVTDPNSVAPGQPGGSGTDPNLDPNGGYAAGDEDTTVPEEGSKVRGAPVYSCGDYTIDLRSFEYNAIQIINNKRAQAGKQRLCVHYKLQRIARYWAKYLADNNKFYHGPFGERLNSVGYNYDDGTCENLHYGGRRVDGADDAVNGWLTSNEGHRQCLYEGRNNEVGLAARENQWYRFWVMDTGNRE